MKLTQKAHGRIGLIKNDLSTYKIFTNKMPKREVFYKVCKSVILKTKTRFIFLQKMTYRKYF